MRILNAEIAQASRARGIAEILVSRVRCTVKEAS
jgi:hypothetical protein